LSDDRDSDYLSDEDGDGNVKSMRSSEAHRFDKSKAPKRIYDSLFKLPARFRFTEKRNEIVKFLTKEGL
jgi:hypothetical protein